MGLVLVLLYLFDLCTHQRTFYCTVYKYTIYT